jgi:hypothetical protein
MATVTLTTANEVLKEIYEDRLRDQLNSEVTILTRIEKTAEGITSEVGGKYVTFPIRVQRNHGIGARNENEALPAAQTPKYASARVSLAYLYGAVQMTGQTMELADSNFQSFISVLNENMRDLKEGLRKDLSRQIYGTSAGAMATANGAGSTTTFVCANEESIYLEVGMVIDIWDTSAAGLMTGGPFTISGITKTTTTTTVTYTGASGAATASGDTIHRYGARNKETIGLNQIVTNANILYNVDPASYPVWKSVVDDNGGTDRALSEGTMIKMIDSIRNTQEFKGGFKGLAFTTEQGDIPYITDVDCQPKRLYFINEDELKFYREKSEWSFMNRDGSNWQRVMDSTGTYDAYQAIMYCYCQLGTHRRNSHGVMSSVIEG